MKKADLIKKSKGWGKHNTAWGRYCPQCGSDNMNDEKSGFEPRYHWCEDCRYGRYHAFPLKKTFLEQIKDNK